MRSLSARRAGEIHVLLPPSPGEASQLLALLGGGEAWSTSGLAEATGGPAFATTAGLLHFALSERAEISGTRHSLEGPRWGVLGRLGHWLKDNF